jgi:hypothetical protein
MAEIVVLRPDEPAAEPIPVAYAARRALPERPVIGLVSNGKPLAKEVLGLLADELAARLGRAVETELLVKPSAGMAMTDGEAALLAARAHVVFTGVGD